HPWLGVQAIDITPSLANMLEQAEMDIPVEEGVLVVQVMNNAPADNVGIRGGGKELRLGNMRLPVGGDIITAIDGKEITKYKELIAYMRSEAEIGEEVEVTLYRNDREITKELEVGERPRQNARR
ncbi:MAG: S1C family serine protease, partial [Sediminispirochaetaceae bacterium]